MCSTLINSGRGRPSELKSGGGVVEKDATATAAPDTKGAGAADVFPNSDSNRGSIPGVTFVVISFCIDNIC